jgi:antitoxin (DNA-binding transcriptional repressor) of toxin-antitoxin stability system
MIIILILGFAVAVIIAIIARQSARRQARITAMIMNDDTPFDENSDKNDDPFFSEDTKGARLRIAIEIAVLFMVVLGAFAAIAILVMTMKWGT